MIPPGLKEENLAVNAVHANEVQVVTGVQNYNSPWSTQPQFKQLNFHPARFMKYMGLRSQTLRVIVGTWGDAYQSSSSLAPLNGHGSSKICRSIPRFLPASTANEACLTVAVGPLGNPCTSSADAGDVP